MGLQQLSLPSPIVEFGVKHRAYRIIAVSCNPAFLLDPKKDTVTLAYVPIHTSGSECVLTRAAAGFGKVASAGDIYTEPSLLVLKACAAERVTKSAVSGSVCSRSVVIQIENLLVENVRCRASAELELNMLDCGVFKLRSWD